MKYGLWKMKDNDRYKKAGSCYAQKVKVALLTILAAALLVSGCGAPQKYESTGVGMGTIITQTLYVKGNAKEVSDKVKKLVLDTEQEISWRIETSEISGINAAAGKGAEGSAENATAGGTGAGYALPKDLAADLEKIWQVSKDSEGALDLTVGPVVRLWDIDTWAAMDEAEIQEKLNDILPTEAEIKDKLSLTGYEKVTIDDNIIYLPEGYMLDMGAVGKGMTCDRILALLQGDMAPLSGTEPVSDLAEVQGAVISLGGNILTYGEKPDGSAWKVGIVDPMEPDTYLGTLTLTGTNFVTTSGDYERFVEIGGVRYHHIIDPATGYPADSGIRSVTILSDNGLLGDALSTACFVLGPQKALELAEKYGADILIVTKTGDLVMSEGMTKILSIKK